MKTRPYITVLFQTLFVIGLLQACGVDPLDPADKFGKTVCEDKTLPDTDGDGINDKCEEILGTNKTIVDSDGDGIPDDLDFPPPQPPPGVNCPQTDPNSYPPECQQYWEANGQRRNNIAEISRAGLLANSALNSKAPNGTQIAVTEQNIRIVYNGQGFGTGGNAELAAFCTDANNAPMQNFIYYKVVGTVKFCNASLDSGVTNCEGTAQPTMLELCGPLNNALVASPGNNQDIVFQDFKWTAGKTFVGKFMPHTLIKEEEAPATLTLTPHDHQNVGDGVYNKMKVKFKKAFQVEGKIRNEYAGSDSNPAGQYGEYVYMETDGAVETLRNFKRTGTINADFENQYPKMLGPWVASGEGIF